MLVNAIIDAIVTEGGFDPSSSAVPRATILGWLQAIYDDALAETHWRRVTKELGPTVAGQQEYAVTAEVLQVKSLRVNGSRTWLRITTEEMFELEGGNGAWKGAPGVFSPNFEADADPVVRLLPAPSSTGWSIAALCAVRDTTALTDTAVELAGIPPQFHRELFVDGGIGMGRRTIDERPDLAEPFELIRAGAKKKLEKLAKSRIGSGAWTAPVGR
jgi:hypothetical protein